MIIVYVIIPGGILYRLAYPDEHDFLLVFGLSCVLGLITQSTIILILKILGIFQLFIFYPVLFIGLFIALRNRILFDKPVTMPASPYLFVLLVLIGMVTVVSIYYSPRILWENQNTMYGDVIYHMSNSAEVLHHWPLENPQVAGEDWNYHHFFSYLIPVGISAVTGIPISDVFMRLLPGFSATLLLILLFSVSYRINNSPAAGLITGFITMFHADTGWALTRYLKLSQSLHFQSPMGQKLYESLTTGYALIYLTAFIIVFHHWIISKKQPTIIQGGVVALLAFIIAGTKLSMMPPLLIGLALFIAIRLIFQGRLVKRVLSFLLIAGCVATPLTLFFVTGNNTAGHLADFSFAAIVHNSPFYQTLVGTQSSVLTEALLIVSWIMGYLGIVGVGAAVFLYSQRGQHTDLTLWMLLVFVVGLILAMVIDLIIDQHQFIDPGQIFFAIMTGHVIAQLINKNAFRKYPVRLAIFSILLIPTILYAYTRLKHGLYNDYFTIRESLKAEDETVSQYADGIEWIRTQTNPDAVLLVNHDGIFLSGFAERRIYYESALMGGNIARLRLMFGEDYEPFPERSAVKAQFFRSPSGESVVDLIETYGEVYLIIDNVEILPRGGVGWKIEEIDTTLSLPEDYVSLAYDSKSIQIYRLINPGSEEGSQ